MCVCHMPYFLKSPPLIIRYGVTEVVRWLTFFGNGRHECMPQMEMAPIVDYASYNSAKQGRGSNKCGRQKYAGAVLLDKVADIHIEAV